jgi:hypothetical protein
MNRRTFLAAAPLAAGAAAAPASAQDGFTSMFDGKTLTGWRIVDGPDTAFYVKDGAIVAHDSADDPTWLRSEREYENFDFRCEFFVKGWIDSGVYIHAPLHGRPAWCGMRVNIFHQIDEVPKPNSMGSIFPLVAPKLVNVKPKGEWNTMRIRMDWPSLKVWVNDTLVQDLNVDSVPDLRHRLRRGYIGFVNLSYPIRFRNIQIRELPSKEKWEPLYESAEDFGKWFISEKTPRFEALGESLWCEGSGHLATKEQYKDFELHLYIRASLHHNGGVLFRSAGKGLSDKRHYEIQLHDVEGAHYPTGSLYYHKRSIYPKIEPEKWFLLQLRAEGKRCQVRINGETVLVYDELADLDAGHIELQAHKIGKWTEFKRIRIKRL